ncbi:MAG: hypothetical protein JWQ79_3612 [Mucilaginibacter sp.]|nr:hypothetical protein [Mucilaginibacter sp.]
MQKLFLIAKKILGLFIDPFRSSYTKKRLRGKHFEIGDHTYGVPNVFHYDQDVKLVIGKFCSIAGDVKIFLSGNHRVDWVSTYPFKSFNSLFHASTGVMGHPASKGNVIIGNDVWIGHSSTILSGVTIGDGAVIANSSVITKNIGAYEIWAGNPARFIKKRFSDDVITSLLEVKWWDWDINRINENMDLICNDDITLFLKKNGKDPKQAN